MTQFKHHLEAAAAQATLAQAVRPYDPAQAAQHHKNALHYMHKAAEVAGMVLADAPEPEPIDPEAIAARQPLRALREAGRGHLVRS